MRFGSFTSHLFGAICVDGTHSFSESLAKLSALEMDPLFALSERKEWLFLVNGQSWGTYRTHAIAGTTDEML